jgi:Protein of unknown function (DUF2934)
MTITASPRGKKSSRRPIASRKVGKRPSSRAGTSKHGTLADPKDDFSVDEWHEMVANAAYYRAEARGFENGDPDEDWYEAEAELRERLASAADNSTDPNESVSAASDDIEHIRE